MFRPWAGTLALAACVGLLAQTTGPGPRLVTYLSPVDDTEQPYSLYVPPSLEPGRKYPLVISLHAEDTSPQICLMRVFGQQSRVADGSLAPLRFFRPRDVGFLVACPQARGTMGYQGIAEHDVYDVLADIERKFPVDPDRVYLTGISMGGSGALALAFTRPDLWAAVAPVAPVAAPNLEPLAANALDLPIRFFHGDQDPINPVEVSRQWQRRLLDLGDPVEYVEYPAARHNAWDYAYRNGAIFEWFSQFRRNRFPPRVRFSTTAYRYSSAYWVRMDLFTPGVAASVDARLTGTTQVSVATENLDGFTLTLDHPVSAAIIDGATIRVPAASTVAFHKQSGKWTRGAAPASPKNQASEGPIAEAVATRHMYVYGTAGDPGSEELAERRRIAESAANWSTPRERLQLRWAVKADTEVTEQDLERDNLVLFGTPETNSLIARFAGRFPMALSPGAADYGLLFIAPIGPHYALVNSGLPWWTGAEDAGRTYDHFQPPRIAELATFGDYVVFKGALGHVVAEGRFGRDWKLSPLDAAKLTAGGVITIP